MTSKERIIKAMKREDVDHLPCSVYFNPNLQVDGYDLLQTEEHVRLAKDLELDPFIPVVYDSFSNENVVSKVYVENQILWQTWQTPAGELTQGIKQTPEIRDWQKIHWDDFSASNIHKPLIECPEDVKKAQFLLQGPQEENYPELFDCWKPSLELAEKYSVPVVMTYGQGLANLIFMMGAENLIYFSLDYPEGFAKLAEMVHEAELKKIRFAAKAGVDILKRFGGYEMTNFFNPGIFREIVVPKLKKEVKEAHNNGLLIFYRVVTGMEPILQDIAEIGFDCIEGGEPHLSQCSLEMWHEAFSANSASWTGISTPVILGGNSTDRVREEVRKCIDIFGQNGYILGVTNSIRNHFPWENTLAMIDEWKKQTT